VCFKKSDFELALGAAHTLILIEYLSHKIVGFPIMKITTLFKGVSIATLLFLNVSCGGSNSPRFEYDKRFRNESYDINFDSPGCLIRGSFNNRVDVCQHIINSVNDLAACRQEPVRGMVRQVYASFGCPTAMGIDL